MALVAETSGGKLGMEVIFGEEEEEESSGQHRLVFGFLGGNCAMKTPFFSPSKEVNKNTPSLQNPRTQKREFPSSYEQCIVYELSP